MTEVRTIRDAAERTIAIPIVTDAFNEPAESFRVVLDDAAVATITIAPSSHTAEDIPALSPWALIALAIALAGLVVTRPASP